MPSQATRHRLVFPVAAALTVGLVSVPHAPGSVRVPRLSEVSAVRLQAEVTSLVTGMVDADDAELRAAASTPTGTGTEADAKAAASCTYPCTIFDKFLSSLPEDVLYAILPTVYVVATFLAPVLAPISFVTSAVMLVTSAIFGWPYPLQPAAAVAPDTALETAPAETAPAASDPIGSQADPVVSSTVPGETANAGAAAVQIAPGRDDNGPQVRGQRIDRTPTGEISAEASGLATEVATAAPPAAEAVTEAITAVEDDAPVERQLPDTRGRSAQAATTAEAGPSDSAPAPQRAAKRSAR